MKNEPGTDSRRAFLGFLVKAPLIPAAVLTGRPAQAAATPPERRVLMNDFAIAGFRYYDGPKELPRLTPGTRLTLRAEPSNPHDCFAVEIHHGPAKLGYVPRFCNQHISCLLLEAVPLACRVERVDPQAPPWEAAVVRVCLFPVDQRMPAFNSARYSSKQCPWPSAPGSACWRCIWPADVAVVTGG